MGLKDMRNDFWTQTKSQKTSGESQREIKRKRDKIKTEL